ncbi:acyl-CoA Delta-9 desaturase [Anabrus simplex]|uniref:acyl-CoA Delta-9 desaturase n=1 Tax=Anabrus simplex TaxID=316456 RepID=UPI0034DD65B9
MPPNSNTTATELAPCSPSDTQEVKSASGRPYKYKGTEIKWVNTIAITLFHLVGFATALPALYYSKFPTVLFTLLLGWFGGFGVTAGVHRLWTHRAYKAKLPLRIFLLIAFATSGQNSIYDWVRDHRVHHRYSETDADPHNVKRGFFFAHVGWLMLHKHPEVIRRGNTMDMSDILADPVARFHEKFFIPMKIVFCFLIPICTPVYVWNESWTWSVLSLGVLRYMLNLNFTWFVNSAAHMWGNKPFDKRMAPVENRAVAVVAMGEGWHNYHHVFPWDYKAAELGDYAFNFTTFGIDQFAKIGWAYDLKKASPSMIKRVAEKYGDGSHPHYEAPPPDGN